ncbi:PTS sugar transporter subunit IIB [Vagococcus zengguangii]|uniref:PTS sugar transporter subunit IIB n=1 Tax=Vagococcus zengguangii TaxID=2571750 RepID=A0A4D7CTX1_9ENTE|nr:PTS sugar transporter subunit IIB [Vagococcus zengguangii]QCI86624.1 PTS sugar transporter subunit IIB [Vagococcus zengguangii]TLG79741.1 PTS sugar transporter subunit IIB [Vagococcus zengguangii]
MEQTKILLCCGAGMSSGFIASNARKVANKKKLPVSVEARSHTEVNEYLSSIDVLMIGPHYANELESFEKLAAPYNVPVLVIPQDVYATLNGEKVIELALEAKKG